LSKQNVVLATSPSEFPHCDTFSNSGGDSSGKKNIRSAHPSPPEGREVVNLIRTVRMKTGKIIAHYFWILTSEEERSSVSHGQAFIVYKKTLVYEILQALRLDPELQTQIAFEKFFYSLNPPESKGFTANETTH